MRVHPRPSTLIRRMATAVVAFAAVLATLGSTALAAPPIVRDHIASSGAAAGSNVCVGSVCTATAVFAIVDTNGNRQACLDITHYDSAGFIPLDYETGCAPLAEDAFSIDTKGLANAALSSTDVTLQAFTCDATGCVPTGATRVAHVSATYTGLGLVDTFRANSKSTFGVCTMYFVGKGSSRQATASLVIDGRSLDALGSLFISAQKIKVICH